MGICEARSFERARGALKLVAISRRRFGSAFRESIRRRSQWPRTARKEGGVNESATEGTRVYIHICIYTQYTRSWKSISRDTRRRFRVDARNYMPRVARYSICMCTAHRSIPIIVIATAYNSLSGERILDAPLNDGTIGGPSHHSRPQPFWGPSGTRLVSLWYPYGTLEMIGTRWTSLSLSRWL